MSKGLGQLSILTNQLVHIVENINVFIGGDHNTSRGEFEVAQVKDSRPESCDRGQEARD